jgi:hypothetical protein
MNSKASTFKAIETKYYGPGNVRGARIKATDGDNTVWIGYPHELDTDSAHRLAAETLCAKLGWDYSMIQGATKRGYVFVLQARS